MEHHLPQDPPTLDELHQEALEAVAGIRGILSQLRHSLELSVATSAENAAAAADVCNTVHKSVCAALRDFARKE